MDLQATHTTAFDEPGYSEATAVVYKNSYSLKVPVNEVHSPGYCYFEKTYSYVDMPYDLSVGAEYRN